MGEHWRPIKNYEGLYWVSDLGNIRSVRVACMAGDRDRFGYRRIVLQNNKRVKRFLIHRLVAEAFIGPREEGMTVNHKNGKKADNRAENLEYLTQGENEQHSFDKLGRVSPGGSRHWNHKITEQDVIQIIALRPTHSLKQLTEKFGVGAPTISMICNRRIWRRVPIPEAQSSS